MIRLGLQVSYFGFPGSTPASLFDEVAGIARAAEGSAFDSFFVMDHFHQIRPMGTADDPMLESYTTLAGVAARTETIQLGALVTGVSYRNPALLGKIVTTLDVVSGGRALLGIGAGWFEEEHRAYDFGFAGARERLDRLEDALRICRAMFRAPVATVEGVHHRVHEAHNVPQPVRPGGPPILVGGGGERRTLRLVALYGDACNLFGDAANVRRKTAVLDRHCEEAGRDPATVERTLLRQLVIGENQRDVDAKVEAIARAWRLDAGQLPSFCTIGTSEEIMAWAQELKEAGLTGLIVGLPDAYDHDAVALAGETLKGVFA